MQQGALHKAPTPQVTVGSMLLKLVARVAQAGLSGAARQSIAHHLHMPFNLHDDLLPPPHKSTNQPTNHATKQPITTTTTTRPTTTHRGNDIKAQPQLLRLLPQFLNSLQVAPHPQRTAAAHWDVVGPQALLC